MATAHIRRRRQDRSSRTLALVALAFAWGLGVVEPGVAVAQATGEAAPAAEATAEPAMEVDLGDDFEEQIHVYQRRPFMRKLRFELAPTFAVAFNETLTHQFAVGANGTFHITDWLFIGGTYNKFFHSESSVFNEVQDAYGVFPERKFMDFYAGGHIGYVPIYGKFILFGTAIVHYDVYLVAGAGVTRTYTVGSDGENRVTGNFGLGSRLFLTEWLTLDFEIRDYIYNEEFKAGDSIVNNLMFQTGLSVFFPFKHSYRYAK